MAANIVAVDSHTNPRMVQIHLKKSLCQDLHIMGSTQGPFFLDAEGKMLTKSVFVHRIRDLLQSGFQAHQYTGHSFRIGAATYSSLSGHGGLHDPDTRQVAQCGFPQVYYDAKGTFGQYTRDLGAAGKNGP